MTLTNKITRKISLAIFAVISFAPFSLAFNQTTAVERKAAAPSHQNFNRKYKQTIGDDLFAEKSIAVAAKVNIFLCVTEGRLKITGWERNEIRAFITGGSRIGFNVREKNKQNHAAWLDVVGSETAKSVQANSRGCLSGEEIELDVPRGAVVSVESGTSQTTIEAVRKATVKNIGGDISLNNIEQGIVATTYEGDVTVENSGGAITLQSANGNIVAFDIAAADIGDVFRAKTGSGAITLQNIGHRQTEVNSNSGSIKFKGEFKNGGQYNFGTQNGTISLAIPEKSSFKINASYGFGAFDSDLKLENTVKINVSRTQNLSASFGGGDANVKLMTYSGAIRIRKQ